MPTCSPGRGTRTRGLLDAAASGAAASPARRDRRHAAASVPPGCAFHPAAGTRSRRAGSSSRPAPVGGRARLPPSRPVSAVSALELENVVVEYERRGAGRCRPSPVPAVEVERGQIVGLVGESGCGKSTLARAAVGMVAPVSGTIRFEGRRSRRSPAAPPAGARAAPARLPEPLLLAQPAPPCRRADRRGAEHARPRAAWGPVGRCGAAARPGRTRRGRRARLPARVFGGAGASGSRSPALAARPSVIVLDEPLASLDASAQAQIANLLGAPRRARPGPPPHLGPRDRPPRRRRVAVMYLGKIVETAPTQALWATPLHPYSEALIGAVPRRRRRDAPRRSRARCPTRRGRPRLRFHTRCPTSSTAAAEEQPPSSSSRRPGGRVLAADARRASCAAGVKSRAAAQPCGRRLETRHREGRRGP